jgi:hypothetical protein
MARVYVISDGAGYIKVGVSDNPMARLLAMQTGNPRDLLLMYRTVSYTFLEALDLERIVHAALDEHAARAEWFQCDASVAIAAILRAGGEGDI